MTEPSDRSLTRRVFVNGHERRLRAGWRLLLGVVVYVAAAIVALLAVSLIETIASVLLAATSGRVVPFDLGSQLFWNVAATILLVALVWLADRRTLPDFGLGGPAWWSHLGFGLVLGVVMTSAVFAVELAAGLVTVENVVVARSGLGLEGASFPVAFAATVALFVAVGVGEEVFFRGYLMTNLAEGLNGLGPVGPRGALSVAAFLTSAIFGVVHYTNPNATLVSTVNITVVGLFLAWTYVVTENLGIPIGIHITWNFSLSSVYGFPVSGLTTPATLLDVRQTGPPLITGGPFGPEAGLVVYLALAVAVGLTWWWVRRTGVRSWFPTGVAVPDLRTSLPTRTDGD